MIKEAWNSLKDNIKDRVTNPFLGTFVVVWVAHNWQVVYSFFYFDKEWKLEKKIQYFKDYWSDKSFFWNLMCVAAITVGILIITYLFLAISRYLANSFENRVVPFIQKNSKGEIVTAEVYQSALDKISSLEAKVEAERKAKNEAMAEREEFEKRAFSGDKVIDGGEFPVLNNANNFSSIYTELIEDLASKFTKDKISTALLDVSKEESFRYDDKIIDFLLANGFIEFVKRDGEYKIYKYTNEGKRFYDEYFVMSRGGSK